MYSCLRLTKIAIALAIGIQLLQPSEAVGKERVKSGSETHSSVALSREITLDPYPEVENNGCPVGSGFCPKNPGSPDDSEGAGTRWIEE